MDAGFGHFLLDSSPLPAVSAPLAAGNAQPVMASRGCWRWDSPTLARVCVRWDWSVRWSSPTARPGACPFAPPLSYLIAWEETVFHAGRERPPCLCVLRELGWLSESLGFAEALSGSVHFTSGFHCCQRAERSQRFPAASYSQHAFPRCQGGGTLHLNSGFAC